MADRQGRTGLRGIRPTFDVCHQGVMVWLRKAAQLPVSVDTLLLPGEKGDVLELDELWSFVRSCTLYRLP